MDLSHFRQFSSEFQSVGSSPHPFVGLLWRPHIVSPPFKLPDKCRVTRCPASSFLNDGHCACPLISYCQLSVGLRDKERSSDGGTTVYTHGAVDEDRRVGRMGGGEEIHAFGEVRAEVGGVLLEAVQVEVLEAGGRDHSSGGGLGRVDAAVDDVPDVLRLEIPSLDLVRFAV